MHILPMGSMGPSVRGNRCLLSPPLPPPYPGKKGQTFSTKVHTCAPPRIRVDTSLYWTGGRNVSLSGGGGGKKKNFSVSRFFKGCSPFFFVPRGETRPIALLFTRGGRKYDFRSCHMDGMCTQPFFRFFVLLSRRDHQVWLPRVVKLFVRDDWLTFCFALIFFVFSLFLSLQLHLSQWTCA